MDLTKFTERDIKAVIDKVFAQTKRFRSVEEAYQQLTQTVYDSFQVQSGESAFVLSRVFHSFDYPLLPDSLQQAAKQLWKEKLQENSKLLILMGSYGKEAAWRDRTQSQRHKAILLTHETLDSIPMMSRLIQQIGFDLGLLLGKDEADATYAGISGTFGVFHVANALGSPYIPAQDFVVRYGVQSVLGTGVMLPQGDICAYIGFTRVAIKNNIAANIASMMSMFWQKAYPLLEEYGMFSRDK